MVERRAPSTPASVAEEKDLFLYWRVFFHLNWILTIVLLFYDSLLFLDLQVVLSRNEEEVTLYSSDSAA